MKRYPDLHLHSLDQFDSQNDPEKVCQRQKELGAEGFALTQHGTLSGIENMQSACDKYGLTLIKGIETYLKNAGDIMRAEHLILLSTDELGYHAIGMAVTEGQNEQGFSVMNDEILNKYFGPLAKAHGHVIATSACIQGPLAAILRQNELVDKQEETLKRRFKSAVTDNSARIEKLTEKLEGLDREVAEAKARRDAAKKLSETKFGAREKKIQRLKDKGDEGYEAELQKLEEDKKKAADAAVEFESLKEETAKLLRKQTVSRQELKELTDLQNRYLEYADLYAKAEEKRITEEEMEHQVKAEIQKFKSIFGEENFYIEVQYHGIELEKTIYPKLAELAMETNTQLVATNDVHIVRNTEDERLRRQILRSMRFGSAFEEEGEGDSELYIKTDEEMTEWLSKILQPGDVMEALENTQVIFDRCTIDRSIGEDTGKHYPKFPTGGKSANEALEEEVEKGIKWRFPDGMDEEHQARLKREIEVIENMGYADYHLIVKDFLEYARILGAFPTSMLEDAPLSIEAAQEWVDINGWKGGISVGPGRGSAVGSLVCYLLGITSMDPIQYGLLFERFLNPERVSMPDIDTDIAKLVRPKVIEYVQNKYGKNAVCGIMTTNALAPKGAIRAAAKYYGLKLTGDGVAFKNLGDTMAKQVPATVGTAFDTETETGNTVYEELQKSNKGNQDAQEILRWAKLLEGCFTTYGAHAAGVVISDNKNVSEYVPLRWNQKLQEWTTQCDMVQVEEKGLLKMDFLGLKTLDIMTGCIRMIKKKTGKVIDPLQIPLDDEQVFKEIFQKGNTNSVFQFESDGMKAMLKRFRPSSFEDLIILVSMFRPGPLQFIDDVIDVKQGRKPETYLTEELRPILGRTYGGIVYQEQVMEIFQKLAGYTLGGADTVRRYMSKKKADKLAMEREAFINGDEARGITGCVKNGISSDAANALFDQMSEFAKYAFNKSHAAAYALISYMTGWLKCHYPAEFLAEAMNWAEDDEAIAGLMRETRHFNVEVTAPDVNASESKFIVKDGKIMFGMGSVKTVGENAETILEERQENGPYRSLKDFYLRTQTKKNAFENLVKVGALDSFCRNRQAMLAVIEPYKELAKKYKDKKSFAEDAARLMPYIDECDTAEKLSEIQRQLGIAVLDKPTTAKKLEQRIANAKTAMQETWDALSGIILQADLAEDRQQRLQDEHEMLGAYVTAHPLDDYDETDQVPIEDADFETEALCGIISELKLKNRKKDGKPMAFFTLEDKSGSIEVSVFTNQYTRCAKYLKEGKVVVVNGKIVEEETSMTDENGLPIKVRKFIADSMTAAKPDRRAMITVSSYAVFHVSEEEDFRKRHETEDGYRFLIYDQTLDQIRPMKYRVDESVFALKNAI